MNSAKSQESMDRIADILGSVRKKGVRLWSENGQLHYKAPKGTFTQEEIEILRVSRGEIVAILERRTGAETVELSPNSRTQFDRAPLAYSQLAHWHLHQLGERRSTRHLASATRLRLRLNLDALQQSVAEIIRRHDALRTRIVVHDGVPIQEISESADYELRVDDLTGLPESCHEIEVRRVIEQILLERIDIAVGPLFEVRVLKLRDDEHVLIIAMEHMISDEFSMNILFRDLFTTYIQALKGRAFSLPAIPVQFPDYAVWQRSTEKPWIEKHEAYWSEHLNGCQRLKFPVDKSVPAATRSGWGTVPLKFGKDLKVELREWCRLRQTTLVMGAFTAYVALVLRWCNASESIIRYESDGRVSPEIENTIGFFASVLYLRIRLLEGDSFVDLMNQVTTEYCQAYEHADFSYLAAQVPRPEFTRSPVFNWIPQGSKTDLSDLDGSDEAITCSPVPFAHPVLKELELDYEPGVLLYDNEDEVVGGIYFPLNRFSIETMERFGRNFLAFVKKLVRQPEERVKDIVLR